MSNVAVPPFLWADEGSFPSPVEYAVPASGEVQPYTATATWDGTNAGGDFVPTISLYSQSGDLLARVFPENVTLAAGDVAEVTFLPPFGSAANNTGPFGTGIQFNKDNEGGYLDVFTNDVDGVGNGMHLKNDAGAMALENVADGDYDIFNNGGPDSNLTIKNTSDHGILSIEQFGDDGALQIVSDSSADLLIKSNNGQVTINNAAGGNVLIEDIGGGNVILHVIGPGSGAYIMLEGLPTSDPGVSGALYTVAGAVFLSP